MNGPAATAAAESADYYSWELPDNPVQVRISPEALERIQADALRGLGLLPRRGVEIGGVLLGTVMAAGDTTSVTVDDVLAVHIEYASGPSYRLSEKDRENLREVLRRWERAPGRPIYAVGFYRSETREALSLTPEDLEVFADYFPDPSSIVLLIRTQIAGPSVVGLFLREGGAITAEPRCLEVPEPTGGTPLERNAAAPGPDRLLPPSFPEGPAPQETAAPEASDPAARNCRRQPLWVSWWIQVPVLAGLLFVDGFLGYLAAGRVQSAPVKAQTEPKNPYALSLLVVQYGDNLHLTWDHNAPALASAERAELSITDGSRSRSLDLSVEQLRNGSVTYRRVSDRVRLRLEVFLKGKRSVSESWDLNGTAFPRL